MLQHNQYGASVCHGVSVSTPAFAGTKLYCMVTGAHGCEQLTQGYYPKRGGRESNLQPSTSLPCGWYQLILLVDTGTSVTTCPGSLSSSVMAGSQTCDLLSHKSTP